MKETIITIFLTTVVCFMISLGIFIVYNIFHEQNADNEIDIEEFYYESDDDDKCWENDGWAHAEGMKFVPDKETAFSIATTVFRANFPKLSYYELNYIFYQTKYGVYLVGFSESTEKDMDGGGLCVAIDEKTGQILNIFGEE